MASHRIRLRLTNLVSSEISDLRNFWLHAMCGCTGWYSTYQIRWENWWL